jgi:hypothetical protein
VLASPDRWMRLQVAVGKGKGAPYPPGEHQPHECEHECRHAALAPLQEPLPAPAAARTPAAAAAAPSWSEARPRPAVHSSYRFNATAVSALGARWPRHGFSGYLAFA